MIIPTYLCGSRQYPRVILVTLVILALYPTISWGYDDGYIGRPRVLMLGDSITTQVNSGVTPTARAIGWQVQEAFAGLANVHLIPENIEDTDYALSEISTGVSHIESWINNETWDIINFNTGLHDMKVGQPQHDVPSSYAVKLGQVVDEIQAHSGSATLVWRETTFVPNPEGSNRHLAVDGVTPMDNVHRYYNAAAAPVIAAKGVTVVDSIATLSESAPRIGSDNVHYTAEGYRQLARPVIEQMFDLLNLTSGMRVDLGTPIGTDDVLQDDYYDFKYTDDTLLVATDLGNQNHVEVTLGNTPLYAWRDRGVVDGAAAELSNLLRDYVLASSGTGPLEVTISGLEAGTYVFTGYFHDSSAFQGVADVDISSDGGLNFTDGMTVAYTTGILPTSVGMGKLMFTSDGTSNVIFHVLANNSSGGNGVSLLNGFSISAAIPGDTNGDDCVDVMDAAKLSDNWCETISGEASVGDFNGDGVVNAIDASIMAANWTGSSEKASPTAVPEPLVGTLLLSLLLCVGMLRPTRKKMTVGIFFLRGICV